jgi:hypothetical protein
MARKHKPARVTRPDLLATRHARVTGGRWLTFQHVTRLLPPARVRQRGQDAVDGARVRLHARLAHLPAPPTRQQETTPEAQSSDGTATIIKVMGDEKVSQGCRRHQRLRIW